MAWMFQQTGYTAMTSLNLGEKFDTSKVLFICSGAFEGIENIESTRVGFKSQKSIYHFDVKKLEKYGMIPELLVRLPVVCKLNSLTNSFKISNLVFHCSSSSSSR